MKLFSIEKPRTGSVTIKLDNADRDRIASLATAKKRTPHYLMKEAILALCKEGRSAAKLYHRCRLRLRALQGDGASHHLG